MNRQLTATSCRWIARRASLARGTWALVVAVTAAGCSTREDSPVDSRGGPSSDDSTSHTTIDSESHFLSFCADGCGDGLRCVCGVCTRVCDESSDCREHDESAECVPPTPANPESCVFSHVERVCDVACSDLTDCDALGPGYVCSAGVCRQAPPATALCSAAQLPVCESGQELRVGTEDDCPTFQCVAQRACPTPLSEAACGETSSEGFTFDAAKGACLVHDFGECSTESNNFASLEACWSGCAPEYQGTCIEGWDANWESADVTPVAQNNLMLEPATITREFALELIEGEHEATLSYPDRTQTRLTLRVARAQAYHVTSGYNPTGSSLLGGAGPQCYDHIVVRGDVSFVTEDGKFDERWQGVRFAVNAWDGFANVSLWVAGDWNEPRGEDEPVAGSYQPGLDSERCSLSSDLSINLVSGALSGGLRHLVVDLPCEDVSDTTPISSPGVPDGTPAPTQAPVPSGPVWSTHVRSVDGQFCAYDAPNRRGPDEPGDSDAAAHLLAGEEPRYRIAADVTQECEAAGGSDCNPESFLTIWAAECVARTEGLEEGIEAWESVLRYVDAGGSSASGTNAAGRVVWIISSTLADEGAGVRSGETLTIDAITGEVLSQSPWTAEP